MQPLKDAFLGMTDLSFPVYASVGRTILQMFPWITIKRASVKNAVLHYVGADSTCSSLHAQARCFLEKVQTKQQLEAYSAKPQKRA